MRRLIGIGAMLLLACSLIYGCGGKSGDSSTPAAPNGDTASTKDTGGGGGKLVIAWAQWKPSDYMEALAKDFTKDTGITVEVKQIPWPQYQQKIQTDVWAGKSDAYDMIVGDSQWLGRGAVEGHYVDLTDWSNANGADGKPNLDWKDYDDNIKTFYCEYNGKMWAVPCEADATGFAYRKDLFEDPKEKADFKAKYKRDLAPPQTWEEFRDVAEFFTRPPKLYGTALFYGGPKTYDGVTMGFMQVLWCEGGELFDPKTKAVQGVINSPAGIKALDFYTKELKKFCPPNSENYYYDDTLQAFTSGQVATTMDWFTFFPGLMDKSKNSVYADKTGFFVSPKGPAGHYISLGGQGLSISAYSKNIDNAKKFVAWFCKADTQKKWAALGGLSCNKQVLASDDFKKATPFNAVFAESVPFLRDFYNNPKYAELLEVTQTEWNAAAAGTSTPQQAMDTVATKQTQILKDAGMLQ